MRGRQDNLLEVITVGDAMQRVQEPLRLDESLARRDRPDVAVRARRAAGRLMTPGRTVASRSRGVAESRSRGVAESRSRGVAESRESREVEAAARANRADTTAGE